MDQDYGVHDLVEALGRLVERAKAQPPDDHTPNDELVPWLRDVLVELVATVAAEARVCVNLAAAVAHQDPEGDIVAELRQRVENLEAIAELRRGIDEFENGSDPGLL